MSIIKIKGDSIEFTGNLDDFKREISRKFVNRNISGNEISKKYNVTIKTLYNWAHKYDTYLTMNKHGLSVVQKMKLILMYDSLKEDDKGDFLRTKGIYDDDILKWRSEILELSDASSVSLLTKNSNDIRSDLRRAKKLLAQKNGELKRNEKELKEAKAIIELQKKTEILFGSEEEE